MNSLLDAVKSVIKLKPNQLLRTTYEKSRMPSAKRHQRQSTGISARQQKRARVAALKARQSAALNSPFTCTLDCDRQGAQEYALL
jgi:hypothetical protein